MIVTFAHRATAVAVTMLVAVAGADAPDSRDAVPIECPAILSAAVAPLITWHPDTPHGIHQFERSVVLELPAPVTTVTVELWGAGGGGGGGSADTFTEGGAGGGGGASGGYARGTFPISPSNRYTVVVGLGGNGGAIHGSGSRGGASAVCENGNALLFAAGGPGGSGAATNSGGTPGGRWDETTVEDPVLDGAVQRAGHDGHRGSAPLFEWRGLGGRGGDPVRGTIDLTASHGGAGGAGAMRPDAAQPGQSGGDGLVIASW